MLEARIKVSRHRHCTNSFTVRPLVCQRANNYNILLPDNRSVVLRRTGPIMSTIQVRQRPRPRPGRALRKFSGGHSLLNRLSRCTANRRNWFAVHCEAPPVPGYDSLNINDISPFRYAVANSAVSIRSSNSADSRIICSRRL